MLLFATSSFIAQAKKLVKKHPDYKTNLLTFIRNKEFDEHWISRTNLLNIPATETDPPKRLMKFRAIDSALSKGKSGGLRFIVILEQVSQTIVLLYFYPKQGKHKKITIKNNEMESLLNIYINEKVNNELIPIEIIENLQPLP